jgi:hypothetical protein
VWDIKTEYMPVNAQLSGTVALDSEKRAYAASDGAHLEGQWRRYCFNRQAGLLQHSCSCANSMDQGCRHCCHPPSSTAAQLPRSSCQVSMYSHSNPKHGVHVRETLEKHTLVCFAACLAVSTVLPCLSDRLPSVLALSLQIIA